MFPGHWCMQIQKSVTQFDLEQNSSLVNVGDSLWETVIEINHCPYCGEALTGNKQRSQQFRHIDYSGWTSKVR